MKKTMFLSIAIAVFTVLSFGETRSVSVTGEAKITVVPDMAYMTIGAQFTETTVKAAMDKVKKAMADVVLLCKELKIDTADIQTEHITVDKDFRWENNSQKFAGYVASSGITVRVKNFDALNKLIEKTLSTDATRMNGLAYSHTKLDSLKTAAMLLSLDDAKVKARKMCERMGVKLGAVISLSNSGQPRADIAPMRAGMERMEVLKAAGDASPGVQVQPGRVEIGSSSFVVFQIE